MNTVPCPLLSRLEVSLLLPTLQAGAWSMSSWSSTAHGHEPGTVSILGISLCPWESSSI